MLRDVRGEDFKTHSRPPEKIWRAYRLAISKIFLSNCHIVIIFMSNCQQEQQGKHGPVGLQEVSGGQKRDGG